MTITKKKVVISVSLILSIFLAIVCPPVFISSGDLLCEGAVFPALHRRTKTGYVFPPLSLVKKAQRPALAMCFQSLFPAEEGAAPGLWHAQITPLP